MKKTCLALVTLIFLCGYAYRAEADLIEVWGSGLMGGSYGRGNSDKDFYKWASGGAAGVEVGAKIIFLGAFVDYLRYFGGSAGANLLTLNLGGDSTFKLIAGLHLVLRLAGGYYIGTLPDNITYTLDNINYTRVNTRGVGIHGGLGLRYTFAKIFSVGITPDFGYHYFFGGPDESITDGNSHGYDINIFGYLRLGIGY